MIWLLKTFAITMILAAGLLVPTSLIINYIKPWAEAIEVIKDQYPNNVWIPQGGSYHGKIRDDGMETIRRELTYLVLPENTTLHITKEKKEDLRVEAEEGGAAMLMLNMLILYSLFFWQAPKVPGRIKDFLDRKSGYL